MKMGENEPQCSSWLIFRDTQVGPPTSLVPSGFPFLSFPPSTSSFDFLLRLAQLVASPTSLMGGEGRMWLGFHGWDWRTLR